MWEHHQSVKVIIKANAEKPLPFEIFIQAELQGEYSQISYEHVRKQCHFFISKFPKQRINVRKSRFDEFTR